MRLSRGFTLLELLVVSASIAVLVGLLLPAVGSARSLGQEVTCAARLRQWGVAFTCYANENAAMWPHCDGLDRGPRALDHPHITPEDVADWHGWVDLLPPLMGMEPWRYYPRRGHPGPNTIYQCPIGRLLPGEGTGTYSYNPWRNGYFSYAMNSCLELDLNAWPPADGVGYPMPSFLHTVEIFWPSEVILLFDQLLDPSKGFDGEDDYRGAGQHCGSYPKSFSARHRRGISKLGGNILYADGHVAWQRSVWKPQWDPALEVPPRDDANWYPYPARDGG